MHPEASLDGTSLAKLEETRADPRDDPEWKKTQKTLVRKLDVTLLPTVWVLYMFNYLDRNNIA